MEILDYYVKSAPSNQNALDIFKGEWTSSLPGSFSSLQVGQLPLFEDPRIAWAVEQLGGVQGKNVLELGPLEAGHTYMLEQFGASSVTAIESNTRAYLKCLIIKEVLGLKRSQFLCGDCVEYLRLAPRKFDICIASGVLYHMVDPAELISLIAQVSNGIYLWTHYYDSEMFRLNPSLIQKFSGVKPADIGGFQHTLYRQEYKTALNYSGFCGGSNPFSHWMSRADILSCLRYFGFSDIKINFEDPNNPNGYCFALVATKR
ncbi:MAG: class I SAM-dependent methyltransferase [Actinomycetota bacterium]